MKGYVEGQYDIEGLYRGQVKGNKETFSVFVADEELQEAIEKWIQRRKYSKLTKLWVKGLTIDWNKIYSDVKPQRISLPTYPFAKQRYWVPGVTLKNSVSSQDCDPILKEEQPNEQEEVPLILTPVWDPIMCERGKTLSPKSILMVGGTQEQLQVVQQYFPNARVLNFQLGETIEEIINKMKLCGTIDHILWIAPECNIRYMNEEALVTEQNNGVLHTFRMIKALNHLGYDSRDLGWTFLTMQTQPIHKYETVNPIHASLHGLIGSMAKEYPNWKIRLVDLEASAPWPIDDLFRIPPDPKGDAWVYRGQQWYRQQLIPLECPPSDQTMYKLGGVYVVIGGAGGIGEVWSEYMIRTYQAQIVWIGRREKNAVIQAKIDELSKLGPSPHYISADATDQLALQRAYAEIKRSYMEIHGVIHSAIVLSDCSLMNMNEEQFKAGIAAKVDVSVRIAQVFKDEPLDFVMIFSSINAFFKAAGQSNYVSGCTFTDVFAHQLAQEWPCAVKVMNWGYWGSVGVVASKTYQKRMKQLGIGSIEPSEGMEALEALLAGPMDQISLMKIKK
ncbi:hypothetical protein CN582_28290 [Bacillus wiedmannii]|nr:hypothetical protein CN582_28290 [Bacillus wiedmannii]